MRNEGIYRGTGDGIGVDLFRQGGGDSEDMWQQGTGANKGLGGARQA